VKENMYKEGKHLSHQQKENTERGRIVNF